MHKTSMDHPTNRVPLVDCSHALDITKEEKTLNLPSLIKYSIHLNITKDVALVDE